MNPCFGLIGWLVGSSLTGKWEEEAKEALRCNAERAKFPTPEQVKSIEGFQKVGPC